MPGLSRVGPVGGLGRLGRLAARLAAGGGAAGLAARRLRTGGTAVEAVATPQQNLRARLARIRATRRPPSVPFTHLYLPTTLPRYTVCFVP